MSFSHLHPLFVHVPLVLPVVILFLVLWSWRVRPAHERVVGSDLLLLSLAYCLFAIASYYSGIWRADEMAPHADAEWVRDLDTHASFGRLALIGAVVGVLTAFLASIATKHKAYFIGLFVGVLCVLSLLMLVVGYSGGTLVHGDLWK